MIVVKRSAASVAKDLAALRAQGVSQISDATDVARRRFVTGITGQDMIYLEKEREAISYIALTSEPADLVQYPFIEAEVLAVGLTAYQVAQVTLYKAGLWRVVGAQIEALRISALAEVEGAVSVGEVSEIVADYVAASSEV